MTFHSLDFLLFFTVMVAVYWRLDHRGQNVWLLAGSYLFYGWVHPWFLALILTSTVVDYWAARAMAVSPGRKRLLLYVSLATNLGLLGAFKYFDFFIDNVLAVLVTAGLEVPRPALAVVLPVGISFYTFQTLSYTIDVYRGELEARRRFLDVAVFVAFFPQLVAGPIERASRLLPQVERRRQFSPALARQALVLMTWGFFKKLVIADNVGVLANKVFALEDPSFEMLWAGVFAFGIQIYADFSAYSDIARGTARWFGFEVMRNFNHPYVASGPADFWRRWHISLSTWFRDYVYIPLGGSRTTTVRWARNILATFALSGLWHGASWNFVLWGVFHGGLLLAGRTCGGLVPTRGIAGRLALPIRVVVMFALVNVGWLLFRETETAYLLRDLALSPADSTPLERQAGLYLFLSAAVYSLPLWLHAAWDGTGVSRRGADGRSVHADAAWWIALEALLCGVLVAGILVLRSRATLDFIYFQF